MASNRNPYAPAAPYDKGPTLSGHTQVQAVDPARIDAVCRAMNAALPAHLQAPAPPAGKGYAECYDPWNDIGYVPANSGVRKDWLNEHMLGHARGGTHDSLDGSGPWHDASWKHFYAHPELAHAVPIPPSLINGAASGASR